jgi:hypothetical protein
MEPDIDAFRQLLNRVAADSPQTPFFYCEAVDAMQAALDLTPLPPCELDLAVHQIDERTHILTVSSATPTFGPQPWLALKTAEGTYHFDNFDIDTPFHRWQYVFDEDTFPLAAVNAIGVAANNAFGTTTVVVMDPATRKVSRKHWNLATTGAPISA